MKKYFILLDIDIAFFNIKIITKKRFFPAKKYLSAHATSEELQKYFIILSLVRSRTRTNGESFVPFPCDNEKERKFFVPAKNVSSN